MFRSTPSPSSSSLSSTDDSPKHFGNPCTGTHKVHYQPQQQWDFVADVDEHPVDLSLVLPHYRARNQPTGHRMSMFVHSRNEIKSMVCRQSFRTPFFLCVHSSSTAPVTLCLPSDFSGKICLSSSQSKVSLSPGFTNNVISRVRFARISSPQEKKLNRVDEDGSDEVEIHAAGHITLRTWDVVEGTPERVAREAWRKMCRRATSSKNLRAEQRTREAIDWDFLLDD
ncbi:hypothetical protein BJV77DRAFT_1064570 [Russula vinacea]|nr:hypothetical protein BJV77DRAFT_1064570 [Russula vinacea]